jgi:hypothetical protein
LAAGLTVQSGGEPPRSVQIVRLVLVLPLAAVCLGVVCRMIYLDGYYYAHAPRTPDSVRGAVVPVLIHHGTRVFLTRQEWLWFASPRAEAVESLIFVVCVGVAVFLARRWQRPEFFFDS